MYRVHPFFRNAAGALFVLLLAAALVTVPAPLSAFERLAVVIGSGGGGGGIVTAQDGDPTDSNDYAGGDIPDGDGGFHEEVDDTDFATVVTEPEPVLQPRILFFGRWSAHLAFENYRGVAMPYFRFFRVMAARGE